MGAIRASQSTGVQHYRGRPSRPLFYVIKNTKNDHQWGHLLSGARDETRTHNPVKEADFKSAAYTNSATRAGTVVVEVRTRVALV